MLLHNIWWYITTITGYYSVLMQTSSNAAFKVLERRSRRLHPSSRIWRGDIPTSDRSQVPAFQSQLATHLTCDNKDDADAESLLLVAFLVEFRTLVVTQNPSSASNLEWKRFRSLVEHLRMGTSVDVPPFLGGHSATGLTNRPRILIPPPPWQIIQCIHTLQGLL